MTWSIGVGTRAPGLGQVLDVQQPYPHHEESLLFSGHNGQVCLIARATTGINPQPFCIALWVYGEEEPRQPDWSFSTFDSAVKGWTHVRSKMEGDT